MRRLTSGQSLRKSAGLTTGRHPTENKDIKKKKLVSVTERSKSSKTDVCDFTICSSIIELCCCI